MRKFLSFFLAVLTVLTVSAEGLAAAAAELPAHLIINQVYGRADKTDAAVSHSFIELYNPTGAEVDLSNWSVQYSKGGNGWSKLNLSGKIPSRCSYLIRAYSEDGKASRYTIPAFDKDWPAQKIDNDQFKVALVSNQNILSGINPGTAGIVDLAGAGEAADCFEGTAPVSGISKQKTARRKRFSDSNDNAADFEILDYRTTGIPNEKLAEVRPRSLSDGAWGKDITPIETLPRSKQVIFSVPAGLYTKSFTLALTTGFKNGIIRYTLDGSDPVKTSAQYTAPLTVSDRTNDPNVLANYTNVGNALQYNPPKTKLFKGTTVKVRVFLNDGTPLSDVFTNSYFVNPNMLTRYNLPVISLVTDKNNFFNDQTGIYVNGNWSKTGDEWERPVHFELFETDGSLAVSQGMGVRISGAWSRNFAQKSLRLYARGEYDPAQPKLLYDLFDGKFKDVDGNAITTFDKFILRNSGNDNPRTLFRDAMMQALCKDLHVDIQDYRQSVVFLNGEFWGIYNIRQRYDNNYFADKYKLDSSKIGMLAFNFGCNNVAELEEGDQSDVDAYYEMYRFFENNSMTLPANYEKAKQYIDIDNFIDYYTANIFINNGDWPHNNNRIWRYKTAFDGSAVGCADGRWRWYMVDTDFGFNCAGGVVTNLLERCVDTTRPESSPAWSTLFFRRLLENSEFKQKFINRMCDNINTVFRPEIGTALIDELAAGIRGIIPEQIERFGAIGSFDFWNSDVNSCKDFANQRADIIYTHMRGSFNLQPVAPVTLKTDKTKGTNKINDTLIDSSQKGVFDPGNWSGKYFAGSTEKITAIPKPGYRFKKFIVTENSTGRKTEYTAPVLTLTVAGGGNTVEALYEQDAAVDLFVSDVRTNPEPVYSNDFITLFAVIRNQGKDTFNGTVEVEFRIDGTLIQTVPYTGSIAPDKFAVISTTVYAPTFFGAHKIRVVANKDQNVFETNYTNNLLSKRFTVLDEDRIPPIYFPK